MAAALVATGYPDLMGNQRPQAIVGDTTVQVRFTAGNAGPTAVTGALFRLDAVAGFTPSAIACANATGGATCPGNLTPQGVAGGVLVDLPSGAGMAFTVTGTVSQTGSIAPRATVVAPGSVTDSNTANNGAQLAITVNPIAPSTLVTNVPAPTYAAGSDLRAAFDYLNAVRSKCGFGLLRQSTALDLASVDQSTYQSLNFTAQNSSLSHTQIQGRPGFTGVTARDRAAFRGYSGIGVGEDLSFAPTTTTTTQQVQNLVQTTYHGASVLADHLDVGIGSAVGSFSFVTVKLGVPQGSQGQTMAGDAIAVSPCDGDVGRFTTHSGESPNPLPGVAFGTYAPPLFAMVRSDQTIVVDEWTIAPAGGSALATVLRTRTNDPAGLFKSNVVALIPTAPLAPNTTYNVVLRGKNSGIPFERRYSFTTGAN
ncbi:MAG: CAP domain-containing protein [Betaproteobacteria bacterium]